MQLYALDGSTPISATHASKDQTYICPECHTSVRSRSGPHRQPHFYHVHSNRSCRQQGKSEEHLALQHQLLLLLGDNAQLECPFPSLSRIADVAWHEKKVIFEIQCSPLSLEEAQARNHDYAQEGYSVIWILHDRRFNRKTLSAAEHYLRSVGCYFTNVNRFGMGEVYDQFETIKTYRRLLKGPKLILSLNTLADISSLPLNDQTLTLHARNRRSLWTHYAHGDLLDCLSKDPILVKKILQDGSSTDSESSPLLPAKKLSVFFLLIKSYQACLYALLRAHCKK